MEEIVIKDERGNHDFDVLLTKTESDMIMTMCKENAICSTPNEARQLADGIYRMLGDKVIVIHDNYGYDDLANDVANVLKRGRWAHLFFDEFINLLKSKLENNG